ncbi:peptidoglycan DD-metalloendopeptidase family protein [Herbiconiux sp. KACC 21604]|uniref:M23 family metallopeptidase n=1 Tax=unclassified Herbiconiux TaxID=2618217 RepID=UPI001490E312|nr:M23 family metallopeptidase [Herbiconiux sp. SALV-R1]QJU54785.1 peptidoglycan DD-metalloendopeptidase family protein [Herbiconiux sp. SALV-R1]WPO85895.1 peptidoglycan DD-metalloendopeptidase family protein [Herbiconiux sp. KACC 21604]
MNTEADAPAATPKRTGRRAGTPEVVADEPTAPARKAGRRAGAAPVEGSAPIEPSAPREAAPAPKTTGRRAGAAAIDDESPSVRSAAGRRARAAAEPAPQADVVAASSVAAPRPHTQRGGRRAAETFSDETSRTPAGRRAKAAAVAAAAASSSAQCASEAAPVPVPPVSPAAAEPAAVADLVIEVEPVSPTGHDTVDVVAEVEAVSAPVVSKPVSRRTLRGAGVDGPASDTVAAATDAASRSATAPVRSRRRAAPSDGPGADTSGATDEPGITDKPGAADQPGATDRPGAADKSGATDRSGAADKPDAPRSAPGGRRSRRGDTAKGAFSVVAMLFAAGIAVATTMPASAFHAATIATGAIAPSVAGDLAAALPGQELTTGSQTLASDITRDGYGVRDLAALRAAGYRIADTFTNNPNGTVQWPFPVGVPISDGFGHRESPGGIGSTDHKGVDFTPGQGTTIQAIADGVVRLVQASDNGGLGVYVIIDHVIDGQAISSVYGHMFTGSVEVTEGQVVKVAQPVGKVGNTGTSTGAHLHFEVRLDGVTPVDPFAWLQANAN